MYDGRDVSFCLYNLFEKVYQRFKKLRFSYRVARANITPVRSDLDENSWWNYTQSETYLRRILRCRSLALTRGVFETPCTKTTAFNAMRLWYYVIIPGREETHTAASSRSLSLFLCYSTYFTHKCCTQDRVVRTIVVILYLCCALLYQWESIMVEWRVDCGRGDRVIYFFPITKAYHCTTHLHLIIKTRHPELLVYRWWFLSMQVDLVTFGTVLRKLFWMLIRG